MDIKVALRCGASTLKTRFAFDKYKPSSKPRRFPLSLNPSKASVPSPSSSFSFSHQNPKYLQNSRPLLLNGEVHAQGKALR